MAKLNLQQPLLQSSVLICGFGAQATSMLKTVMLNKNMNSVKQYVPTPTF